jgi:hypothetical protein
VDIDASAFARQVAGQVSEQCPVAWQMRVEGEQMSTVEFLPTDPQAVSIAFSANFDGTYQVNADRNFVDEHDGEPSTLSAQVDSAVTAILDLAKHGLVTVRLCSVLGPLSPTIVGSPESQVVRSALGNRWATPIARSNPWPLADSAS